MESRRGANVLGNYRTCIVFKVKMDSWIFGK